MWNERTKNKIKSVKTTQLEPHFTHSQRVVKMLSFTFFPFFCLNVKKKEN